MPSIKETTAIIDNTPIDQAIVLEGIHGIGKSEVVVAHYKKLGYRCEVLFLGQMADSGDVIGLPSLTVDENGNEYTNFSPPGWWPRNKDEKVLIFLDELNRGKPEVMQCVMDMILNRKLNGRELPPLTKIVAAMNPADDNNGFYQVDELDPAMNDRFNKYVFQPTVGEWLNWASKAKVHPFVIGFITKKTTYLDPETDANKAVKIGDVQPSRRSWKRVSDILKGGVDKNITLLGTMCLGIIGARATAPFIAHVKAAGKGLGAGKILTATKEQWIAVEAELMTMSIQSVVALNREIAQWFKEESKSLKQSRPALATSTSNVQKYLEVIPAECMAEFFDHISEANAAKEQWPSMIVYANPNMATKMFELMTGKPKARKTKEVDLD